MQENDYLLRLRHLVTENKALRGVNKELTRIIENLSVSIRILTSTVNDENEKRNKRIKKKSKKKKSNSIRVSAIKS